MQKRRMALRVAQKGSFTDADHYRRSFPDGRIGSDPNLATPEHGKRIYETAVEDVARDYEAWVARSGMHPKTETSASVSSRSCCSRAASACDKRAGGSRAGVRITVRSAERRVGKECRS